MTLWSGKRGGAGELLSAAGSRRDQTVPESVDILCYSVVRRCGGRLGALYWFLIFMGPVGGEK
jgi:hypothetical protein